MINEFIDYITYQKKYSINTITNYKNDIDDFVKYIKHENFDAITYNNIRGYLSFMHEKKYTASTINRKLSSLRSLYKYLNNKKRTTNNPLELVTSLKKEKKLPKFLYYEELEKLFAVPDLSDPFGQRDRLILELLYATGLRVFELTNIKINDINDNQIKVLGKGNKERIVIFGEYAKEILDLYLNDGRTKLNINSEYLFINNQKTKLTDRGVRDILNKIQTNSGLKTHIAPHMIRHTFATHMLNEGSDLMSVQKLLGHKNLKSTGIYTHVTNERLRHLYRDKHPRSKDK